MFSERGIPEVQYREFLSELQVWYDSHQREDLPWRSPENLVPYNVIVSEIMLQQTQVARVTGYYAAWMQKYPDVYILAQATLSDVLMSWQGLGYNNRGMRLHKMAQIIVNDYNGVFPATALGLVSLPGVGDYTAAAVMAFVHNTSGIAIETNIRRVIIYEFFRDKTNISDREIAEIVLGCLPILNTVGFDVRNFYWAMMDYGSYLKSSLGYNPNKQTKAYTKQSVFTGSFREKRSKILSCLLSKKPMKLTLDELYKTFTDWSDDDIDTAVQALYKDGLVKIADDGISIL
jgi:A/G-specific adenine glycosylase